MTREFATKLVDQYTRFSSPKTREDVIARMVEHDEVLIHACAKVTGGVCWCKTCLPNAKRLF